MCFFASGTYTVCKLYDTLVQLLYFSLRISLLQHQCRMYVNMGDKLICLTLTLTLTHDKQISRKTELFKIPNSEYLQNKECNISVIKNITIPSFHMKCISTFLNLSAFDLELNLLNILYIFTYIFNIFNPFM